MLAKPSLLQSSFLTVIYLFFQILTCWKPSDPILRVIFPTRIRTRGNIPANHCFLCVPTQCRTQTLPGIWGTRRVADKLHQPPFQKWHFYSFALCVSQSEGCDCSDCWVQSADTYTLIKVQLMTSGTFFFLTHCQPPFSMVFRLPVKSRQAGKHLMEMIQSSERCDRLKHRHRREGFANNVEDVL